MNEVVKALVVKAYQSTVPGKGSNCDESEIMFPSLSEIYSGPGLGLSLRGRSNEGPQHKIYRGKVGNSS